MTKFKEFESRFRQILCVSSICTDKKHIIIWDFDEPFLYLSDIKKSLGDIQRKNGLGYIYIFKSENGFNAVCLDKVNINECYNIKMNTKYADVKHNRIGYTSDSWAWRIGNDKKLIFILKITDIYHERTGSNAHRLYLEKIFNIKIDQGVYDNETKLQFEKYGQNR